jgi:hypothetical protein
VYPASLELSLTSLPFSLSQPRWFVDKKEFERKIKTHSRQIPELWPAVYKELVSPIVCNLFVTNEQVDGDIYRHYMWVFNTMIGDFAEYSFLYTYNGSNYVPVGSVCGGQTAVTIIMDVDRANDLNTLSIRRRQTHLLILIPLYSVREEWVSVPAVQLLMAMMNRPTFYTMYKHKLL